MAPAEPGWRGFDQRRPPPPPAYAGPPGTGYGYGGGFGGGFGTAALWALLGALSVSDRSAFIREHESDPAYQAWRRQAEQEAARDPAAAERLRALDSGQAQLPPPPQPAARPSGGSGIGWLLVFVALAAFVLLWLRRRRGRGAAVASGTPGLSGSAATRLRVGMTIPLDPAPFLLAADTTKVQPPPGGGMLSVEAIGLLREPGVQLHRLYLPGRVAFFQLHLGRDGAPDECRYFSRLDQVMPADPGEWRVWLDPAEGLIGWPAFETKDGKTYGRAWAPGQTRVPPRAFQETIQALEGTTERRLQAMLYAAPTGASPPAPEAEYVLVAAVEAAGQAWVDIHAGIDINPAALTLPPVALEPARSAA